MNTVHVHAKMLQSYPTLCNPMDCSPPGSSVCGILQAHTTMLKDQICILSIAARFSCRRKEGRSEEEKRERKDGEKKGGREQGRRGGRKRDREKKEGGRKRKGTDTKGEREKKLKKKKEDDS